MHKPTEGNISFLSSEGVVHTFLKPLHKQISIKSILENQTRTIQNEEGIEFWEQAFIEALKLPVIQKYRVLPASEKRLQYVPVRHCTKKQSLILQAIRIFTGKKVFGDVTVFCHDTSQAIRLNYRTVEIVNAEQKNCDLSLHSSSLRLLLTQPYGLDTLTINGRLKEINAGGFTRLVFSLGFVAFNAANFGVTFRDLIHPLILRKVLTLPPRMLVKSS